MARPDAPAPDKARGRGRALLRCDESTPPQAARQNSPPDPKSRAIFSANLPLRRARLGQSRAARRKQLGEGRTICWVAGRNALGPSIPLVSGTHSDVVDELRQRIGAFDNPDPLRSNTITAASQLGERHAAHTSCYAGQVASSAIFSGMIHLFSVVLLAAILLQPLGCCYPIAAALFSEMAPPVLRVARRAVFRRRYSRLPPHRATWRMCGGDDYCESAATAATGASGFSAVSTASI